jgi:glycerol kinase
MEEDSGIAMNQLCVDGGASTNNLLMPWQRQPARRP